MNTRLLIACLAIVATGAIAADLDTVPARSIARKRELLFSDNFQGADHDKRWHRVVDTFAFENGALKGTQTREKDTPSADGKSVITAHAAVYGLELPTRDSVVECRIRFEGANGYTSSNYRSTEDFIL